MRKVYALVFNYPCGNFCETIGFYKTKKDAKREAERLLAGMTKLDIKRTEIDIHEVTDEDEMEIVREWGVDD